MSKLWQKIDDDAVFCSVCGFDIKNNNFFEAQNAAKKNIGGKERGLWREWINRDTNGQSQYWYLFLYWDCENMVVISASEEHLIGEVIA